MQTGDAGDDDSQQEQGPQRVNPHGRLPGLERMGGRFLTGDDGTLCGRYPTSGQVRHPAPRPLQGSVGARALRMGLQRSGNVGQARLGIVSQVSEPQQRRLVGRILVQHGLECGLRLGDLSSTGRPHPCSQIQYDRHSLIPRRRQRRSKVAPAVSILLRFARGGVTARLQGGYGVRARAEAAGALKARAVDGADRRSIIQAILTGGTCV
jgi:hypothetical protein